MGAEVVLPWLVMESEAQCEWHLDLDLRSCCGCERRRYAKLAC
jgi:hypothetical protein